MAKYLTCDTTDENVTFYEVDIDGVMTRTPAVNGPEGIGKHLWFDLTPVEVGPHIVKARAGNDWGVSAWTADLPFSKDLPTVPGGLRLEDG
jgi:hypothetical protein